MNQFSKLEAISLQNKTVELERELEKANSSWPYFGNGIKVLKTSFYSALLAAALALSNAPQLISFSNSITSFPAGVELVEAYMVGNDSKLNELRNKEEIEEYVHLFESEIYNESYKIKKNLAAGFMGFSLLNMIGGVYAMRRKEKSIESVSKKINQLGINQ